jgi:cob(I)alamin adenosyltransferase
VWHALSKGEGRGLDNSHTLHHALHYVQGVPPNFAQDDFRYTLNYHLLFTIKNMKIYTRSGDGGETGLCGGVRVWKNSPRLETIGTIDELNAALGLLRTERLPEEIDRLLDRLQHDLFDAGAELASVASAKSPSIIISQGHIQTIEELIDQIEARLPPLTGFILPGGIRAAAMFHTARTICRRAERHMVALAQLDKQAVSPHMLAYINRLSDLLYILARLSNTQAGVADVPRKTT